MCLKKNKYKKLVYKKTRKFNKKHNIKKYWFTILIIIAAIIVIPIWGWIIAVGGALIYFGWNVIDKKH